MKRAVQPFEIEPTYIFLVSDVSPLVTEWGNNDGNLGN